LFGNVQDIDLKLLRVFRAVAHHGGFAAAQTELGVSLPTISNQIKQLEERLGMRLCDRGSLGFALTPQGKMLIEASDALFSAVDGFRKSVAELALKPVGEIKLGIVDSLATDPQCRVPQAIASLHRNFPGVSIRFFIGPPSELESQVLNGTLDLAIGLFPAIPAALDADKLFDEAHGLFCGEGHPLFAQAEIQPSDLRQSAYVSWAYQEAYVSLEANARFDIQGGTPFIEGLLYLMLSGVYIGYLPRHVAAPWLAAGKLRELLPAQMARTFDVSLITRRSQRSSAIVGAFRQELVTAHEAGQVSVG
jgi:DNA-binding transcriptional LysR family regulator